MAEYDAGTVKATMTADASGSHAAVQGVKKDYADLKNTIVDALKEVNEGERQAAKAADEAAKATKKAADEAKSLKDGYRDLSIATGASFAAITAGIWKALDANNQLKNSFTGLDSVAVGTVGNYDKIKAELQRVQDEGMIPLTNATAAYKNLLMRYQDEEVAIQIFNRLADAAAFGRQGHLQLGEAIQGATEGLKNEMSQMVDNAGVTKNVSQMWADYAAQIGKGAMSWPASVMAAARALARDFTLAYASFV